MTVDARGERVYVRSIRGLLPSGSMLAVAALIAAVAISSSGGESAGATAGSAHEVARGSCPDTLCVFTETNFTGQHADVTKLGLSNKLDNKIPGQAMSLINDRQSAAFFYAKRDGKGRTMCINSGDYITDLAQVQLVGASSTRLVKRKSCFPH